MDIEAIRLLTIELGEGWGYPHAERVLRLIEAIGEGLAYDREVVAHAAYLHDWGAYPKYRVPGVDHALRSRQVAETEVLPLTSLSPARQLVVAGAIETHDYRDRRPSVSVEGLLLREADMLEILGVIGIARELAWGPNDLQVCVDRVIARREGICGRLRLPVAQAIAAERIARMDEALRLLREESFGIL